MECGFEGGWRWISNITRLDAAQFIGCAFSAAYHDYYKDNHGHWDDDKRHEAEHYP